MKVKVKAHIYIRNPSINLTQLPAGVNFEWQLDWCLIRRFGLTCDYVPSITRDTISRLKTLV